MLDANATVEWTPPSTRSGWTTGCATWATGTSRASATSACRCRSTRATCGHLNVIGSRAELEERATCGARPAPGAAPALDRRGADPLRGVRRARSSASPRSATPGSTPASSTSRRSAGRTRSGSSTATRRARPRGLTGADLPDHAYWEQWFPADWVSEMREQIRLWFYSQCFMAVTLDGPRAVPARAHVREGLRRARRARCTSRGATRSRLNEALERMGADVMRWLYCDADAEPDLRFGYGPADEVKRRLLTLWNSVSFFVTTRTSPASSRGATRGELEAARPLARSRASRSSSRDATDAYERFWTPDVDRGVRGLRRRSLELVHPPLAPALLGRRRGGARSALARAHARARVIAPVMPFLAEHLWRVLRLRRGRVGLPRGWPEAGERDEELLAEVGGGAAVVELGRQARDARGSSCGSRCAGSSSRARRWPPRTWTRSATSYA